MSEVLLPLGLAAAIVACAAFAAWLRHLTAIRIAEIEAEDRRRTIEALKEAHAAGERTIDRAIAALRARA